MILPNLTKFDFLKHCKSMLFWEKGKKCCLLLALPKVFENKEV
jgi:hypothetical protein